MKFSYDEDDEVGHLGNSEESIEMISELKLCNGKVADIFATLRV